MNRKGLFLISLVAMFSTSIPMSLRPQSTTAAATLLSGNYNLLGYEGIGTLGNDLSPFGTAPPVGDYVSTHCRYIDVPNTENHEYYLRYPLHLPDGATITQVELHVADFTDEGRWVAHMRSRPWNSRDPGLDLGFSGTNALFTGDHTFFILNENVVVDNQANVYWVDATPSNSATPGQLCVYGIQVTYTYEGGFLPLIRKGG